VNEGAKQFRLESLIAFYYPERRGSRKSFTAIAVLRSQYLKPTTLPESDKILGIRRIYPPIGHIPTGVSIQLTAKSHPS
jgi:hypothetical protein